MAENSVNGSGKVPRAGAGTLLLLAAPLNVLILRALTDSPKRQAALQREAYFAAQTTLRAQLGRLVEVGGIAKRRRNRFPGTLEYELTPAGRELTAVATVLETWLGEAPAGSLEIGGDAAKAAISALAKAWSSTILRALAARSLSLTELNGLISSLSYPAMERRLTALRLSGLITTQREAATARGVPYAVTTWLRRAVGPLLAAAQWERQFHDHHAVPLDSLDFETALLLATPLLTAGPDVSVELRLAVEVSGNELGLAGVSAEIEEGVVISCTTHLGGDPDAWALGAPGAWFDALLQRDVSRLELGGNTGRTRHLLAALHDGLFSADLAHHPALDAEPSISEDESN